MADKLGRKRKSRSRSWGKIELRGKRWRASYAHPYGEKNENGKVKRIYAPETFATKDAADKWLSKQRTLIDNGWTAKTPRVQYEAKVAASELFEPYAERYIEEHLTANGTHLKKSTKEGYRRKLKAMGPEILEKSLGELAHNPEVITSFYRNRISDGKMTSASHIYVLVQQVLAKAVEDGIIDTNPCRNQRTGRTLIKGATTIRTDKKAGFPLITEEQLKIAIDYLRVEHGEQAAMMTLIAAYSAVRFGELTALRLLDLSDDGEIITLHITRSVTHTALYGCDEKLGTKTGYKGVRDIELLPAVSAEFRKFISETITDEVRNPLIFPAINACHYPNGTMNNWWLKAREKAGCPHITFHDLRHFGLTEYARIPGVTIKDIMGRGGHISIEIALKYQHIADEPLRKEHVRQMKSIV